MPRFFYDFIEVDFSELPRNSESTANFMLVMMKKGIIRVRVTMSLKSGLEGRHIMYNE